MLKALVANRGLQADSSFVSRSAGREHFRTSTEEKTLRNRYSKQCPTTQQQLRPARGEDANSSMRKPSLEES